MIPATREHVQIEGQRGTFLVIWVDQESGTAQLVPLAEGDEVLSVPFSSIRLMQADALATNPAL